MGRAAEYKDQDGNEMELDYRPAKRRAYGKRKATDMAGRVVRRKLAGRMPMWKQLNEHKYRRSYSALLWTTATGQATSIMFRLVDVPNSAEFANLYDQYRLDWATVWAIPAQNSAEVDNGARFIPTIYSAVDHDDNTAPANLNEILERNNKRITTMDKKYRLASLAPTCLQEVYRSAIATNYSPKSHVWLNVAATDVPHYGMKMWVEPALGANNSIRVIVDLYFTCRASR